MLITAQEIKKARAQLGLTQQQLANKLGVEQTSISQWERSEYQCSKAVEIKALLAGQPIPRKPETPLPQGMCVYIIKAGNAVKVGYTGNIRQRLQRLQIASPVELTLLGWIKTPNPKTTEARIHKMLNKYRLHGEWYAPPVEVLLTIAAKYQVLKVNLAYSKVIRSCGRNVNISKAS